MENSPSSPCGMGSITLCEFCKKLNFESLRNPLVSDLPAISEGRVDKSRYPFRFDPRERTPLGSFSGILQRRRTCPLCRLVGDALIRHKPHKPRDAWDKDHCAAVISTFGHYHGSRGERYWVRRLSIFVQQGDEWTETKPLALRGLFHVFHSCSIGATSAQAVPPFADPQRELDTMLFGGRRRPLVLDIQWVRRWMEICMDGHGMACERADVDSNRRLPIIRFIDVEQMCVVTLENVNLSEHRYLALSYVWGGPPEVKLEKPNQSALAQPRALVATSLPNTVSDSIVLAKSLGFRHLWVDALCILQDDDQDKRIQVDVMSQIYGFACLTIVAASSSDAGGGLPGVRPGTRWAVQEEVVVIPPGARDDTGGDADPGLSLMTTLQPLPLPGEHILERAPWSSRGWTLQERVLSRRMLIFMPEQVHWVCRAATYCEESYFENRLPRFRRFHQSAVNHSLWPSLHWSEPDGDDSLRSPWSKPDRNPGRFWGRYQSLVADYTRRAFSYQGDVFDGFRAVMQSLSALSGEEFIWGLPRSHFEFGLLWCSARQLSRRTGLSTLPMTSFRVRVPFPSWSWMGWVGEALVWIGEPHDKALFGGHPEILCFEHQHAPLRLEPVRRNAAPSDSTEHRVLPKWKASHNQPVTLQDLEAEHPLLYPRKLSQVPESQLVFFWTSSASFALVRSPYKCISYPGTIVVDSSGDVIGAMITTETHRTRMPFKARAGREHPRSLGQHEFIVLGWRDKSTQQALSEYKSLFPALLVLQIEWRDGIAYRVGCGEIGEEAWQRADHMWKLIVLG